MSRAKRLLSGLERLYGEYGQPLVDEIVEALGGDATPDAIRKEVKQRAKAKPKAPAVIKRAAGANRRAAERATYDARELATRYPPDHAACA